MKCFVSASHTSRQRFPRDPEGLRQLRGVYGRSGVEGTPGDIPCVTKLPKLRPTMQCQVGPFLSSNWLQEGRG